MGKRKRKKQQRPPIRIQQTTKQSTSPSPSQANQRILKKIPHWLWTALSIFVAIVGLLFELYPSLSINQDYAFDTMFPYNTSFSVTDEGFWPVADLSVVCSADFTMLPWTTNPSNKSSMDLHTQSSEYKDFPKILFHKQRITLPCNHNVIANGHRIAPDAKLHIKTTYRLAGTDLILHKTFEFRTVEGWRGQQFWQYQ
ncbi:MAG TPA: hypothetical protein VND90_04610 [Terracidiphilus sp.]|nr:hypothetical protein [Terracidiphilus sp.]